MSSEILAVLEYMEKEKEIAKQKNENSKTEMVYKTYD